MRTTGYIDKKFYGIIIIILVLSYMAYTMEPWKSTDGKFKEMCDEIAVSGIQNIVEEFSEICQVQKFVSTEGKIEMIGAWKKLKISKRKMDLSEAAIQK